MIDENEAPEGYKAVESKNGTCEGCDFWPNRERLCEKTPCTAGLRKDKTDVIFVKKEDLNG